MSQRTFGLDGGDAFELIRLNRALAHLTRPTLTEVPAQVAPSRRKELIARLWSRKRRLMRAAKSGRRPAPPVA